MAKRAAELDAYRKLAQRIMDIRIDSQTTVRDACLESDEIVANLSQVLKGAEATAIRYLDDGSCEVEMKITKQDIVRAVSNSQKGRASTARIEDSIQEKSFTEKGRGTMHSVKLSAAPAQTPALEVASAPQPIPPPKQADAFFETETIIRRLLDSKPVQR